MLTAPACTCRTRLRHTLPRAAMALTSPSPPPASAARRRPPPTRPSRQHRRQTTRHTRPTRANSPFPGYGVRVWRGVVVAVQLGQLAQAECSVDGVGCIPAFVLTMMRWKAVVWPAAVRGLAAVLWAFAGCRFPEGRPGVRKVRHSPSRPLSCCCLLLQPPCSYGTGPPSPPCC